MKLGEHCFGMFAKHWEPGMVKTRLAVGVGHERAAAVYRAFLETQLARYATCSNPTLIYSPDKSAVQFRSLLANQNSWQLQAQGEGDLGERMQRFFQMAFTTGYDRATLVGSDTPTLPLSYIRQADALLRVHEVVLGPTWDGGYYLVAAKRNPPPIFSDVQWSSANVWQQTIERLQKHRIRFAVLPTWYDVDNWDDLCRLRTDLQSEDGDTASQLREQLDSILANT